jgi:dephospho-CoA kinase
MQRDHATPEQVRERMSQQISDDERRRYATHIIINDGRDLESQLAQLVH